MKLKAPGIIIIIALLAGGVSLAKLISSGKARTPSQEMQKKPPEVRTVAASKGAISKSLELTGSVEPYRLAQLASPAEGPVLNLRVREGDQVKTGDTLLAIGRTKGIEAQIASLREDLQKEEDNLKRTQQLVQSDALPGEQLDQAKAAYERARAQLVKAMETAQDFAVTAPWAGVVSRTLVKEGAYVAPRASLVEVYDPNSLVIRAAVPEQYSAEMRGDIPVTVKLDAHPGPLFTAKIVRVYPFLDPQVRTRTIEIGVTEPVSLLPGMFARLTLKLETVADAVAAPVDGIVTTPAGKQVAFVVKDGKAVRREVVTGIEEGKRVQIIAGIEPGEEVVVAGGENLKDGMEVRLSKTKPASAAGKSPEGSVK